MLENFNYFEAGLWGAIGLLLGVRGMAHARKARRVYVFAALVFLLFGLSDVVEAQTGAWWRPWWLLLWKTACVVSMLILFESWRRKR